MSETTRAEKPTLSDLVDAEHELATAQRISDEFPNSASAASWLDYMKRKVAEIRAGRQETAE